MFGDEDILTDGFDDDAFHLLEEMEQNTPEEVRRKRAHFRVSIKAGVVIQPGNATDLHRFKLQGVTGDLSSGGCKALFPLPTRVGDVYRMRFDQKIVDLPLVFAQCVRCLLIQEEAYEAGFRFFSPICLAEPEGGGVAARAASGGG